MKLIIVQMDIAMGDLVRKSVKIIALKYFLFINICLIALHFWKIFTFEKVK